MKCKCGSYRIVQLNAKHSDAASFRIENQDIDLQGTVPYLTYSNGTKFLGGDYLNLVFCAECGQIQNFQRITDEDLDEYLDDSDLEE